MVTQPEHNPRRRPIDQGAAENVPIPMSRTLEPLVQPSEAAIADAVRALVGQR